MNELPPQFREAVSAQLNLAPKSKYGARPTVINGIRFDSALEGRRYAELCRMREAKLIDYFLRRVAFDLPGKVRHFVDFMIVENDGRPRYEDVKGMDLAMGKLKRRQVLDLYGVEITLWPAR